MGGHELTESLLVLSGGDHRGQGIPRHVEGGLDPGLELLVPRVLAEVVYDPAHELSPLCVDPHQQRVVHHVDQLGRHEQCK